MKSISSLFIVVCVLCSPTSLFSIENSSVLKLSENAKRSAKIFFNGWYTPLIGSSSLAVASISFAVESMCGARRGFNSWQQAKIDRSKIICVTEPAESKETLLKYWQEQQHEFDTFKEAQLNKKEAIRVKERYWKRGNIEFIYGPKKYSNKDTPKRFNKIYKWLLSNQAYLDKDSPNESLHRSLLNMLSGYKFTEYIPTAYGFSEMIKANKLDSRMLLV